MKYAIIGFPVDHSLSPQMHEAGYRAMGLGAVYHRIPVELSKLGEGVKFLKENGYAGWNVTYPLKEEIRQYLDIMTTEALECGAVNTVKAEKGILYGHNTDGGGFAQSLIHRGYDFCGKNVVVLGAGGSARAIATTLGKEKCQITIRNRTPARAQELAEIVSELGGTVAWGSFESGSWLNDVDLLIQTTPSGMNGEYYPLDLQGINPAALVVDLLYHPKVTPFLSRAAASGCFTMNGLDMLLFQGVLAWKYWFGTEAPVDVMRHALFHT